MGDFKIVVVGGSAGGVEASLSLAAGLSPELDAAVCIALHLAPTGPSLFAELLDRRTNMNVSWARDGDAIRPGHIYVAPPDQHLLIEPGYLRLGRGPRENGHRPAIDPLFRTAAHVYCERVIGVILSGNLDDGSAGLDEIRKMGGKAIVQDPADSPFNSMPLNAIEIAGADAVVPALHLAETIHQFVTAPNGKSGLCEDLPDDIAAGGDAPMSTDEREQGQLSGYGCPDCGGALWEVRDGELVRYRCRVGHAYTEESLLEAMTDGVERAMWASLRALEEQAAQAHRLARRMKARGHAALTERFTKQALDAEQRAALIREALLRVAAGQEKTAD